MRKHTDMCMFTLKLFDIEIEINIKDLFGDSNNDWIFFSKNCLFRKDEL